MLQGQVRTEIEQLETLLAINEKPQDDFDFFRTRWTTGTCDWILSNPASVEWADQRGEGPTMLWLHALPASGKSILSSFVINYLLEESLCMYYFFRFGDQSKRSLSSCLRTIAFQIAEQLPRFRRVLKDIKFTTKTAEKTDAKTIGRRFSLGSFLR